MLKIFQLLLQFELVLSRKEGRQTHHPLLRFLGVTSENGISSGTMTLFTLILSAPCPFVHWNEPLIMLPGFPLSTSRVMKGKFHFPWPSMTGRLKIVVIWIKKHIHHHQPAGYYDVSFEYMNFIHCMLEV